MSLIIKNKIQQLLKGYPTVSDKYDVAPAVVEDGSGNVKAGELVIFGSTTGRYKKPTANFTAANVAGFVLATNVKVPGVYPANGVQEYAANEAFNLMFKGFIAIEIDLGDKATTDIKEGAQVAFFKTAGQVGVLTVTGAKKTPSGGSQETATDLPGAKFTGVLENKGTAASPIYYAEIAFNVV